MSGDDKVLGEILDSPKEKRDILFGVYRHAYVSRLVETLRNDHEHLHGYLGDEMFDAMGVAYVAAKPSQDVLNPTDLIAKTNGTPATVSAAPSLRPCAAGSTPST